MLPPLKPLPIKDRRAMLFLKYGQLDVIDGAFVLVDKDGDHATADVTFNVNRAPDNTITLSSSTSAISAARLFLLHRACFLYNQSRINCPVGRCSQPSPRNNHEQRQSPRTFSPCL